MDFGSIAGAIGLGSLADTASSALNYYAQRDLMHEAQDWQRYVMQNQKQWQVADLKKAGLNPVLATGLGVSAPSSPTTTFTGATSQGMREALASVRKRESQLGDQQLEKLKAETKAAEAVARSASAQAVKDEIDADNVRLFWRGLPDNDRRLFVGQQILPGSTIPQMTNWAQNIADIFGFSSRKNDDVVVPANIDVRVNNSAKDVERRNKLKKPYRPPPSQKW